MDDQFGTHRIRREGGPNMSPLLDGNPCPAIPVDAENPIHVL